MYFALKPAPYHLSLSFCWKENPELHEKKWSGYECRKLSVISALTTPGNGPRGSATPAPLHGHDPPDNGFTEGYHRAQHGISHALFHGHDYTWASALYSGNPKVTFSSSFIRVNSLSLSSFLLPSGVLLMLRSAKLHPLVTDHCLNYGRNTRPGKQREAPWPGLQATGRDGTLVAWPLQHWRHVRMSATRRGEEGMTTQVSEFLGQSIFDRTLRSITSCWWGGKFIALRRVEEAKEEERW